MVAERDGHVLDEVVLGNYHHSITVKYHIFTWSSIPNLTAHKQMSTSAKPEAHYPIPELVHNHASLVVIYDKALSHLIDVLALIKPQVLLNPPLTAVLTLYTVHGLITCSTR